MACMLRDRRSHGIDHSVARTFLAQEFNVFRPWERDQDAHPGGGAAIEKPERRRVINAQDVQSDLAHLREIPIQLFWSAKIVPCRIRFERAIGHALNEKLVRSFKEEFRDSANGTRRSGTHRRVS